MAVLANAHEGQDRSSCRNTDGSTDLGGIHKLRHTLKGAEGVDEVGIV